MFRKILTAINPLIKNRTRAHPFSIRNNGYFFSQSIYHPTIVKLMQEEQIGSIDTILYEVKQLETKQQVSAVNLLIKKVVQGHLS